MNKFTLTVLVIILTLASDCLSQGITWQRIYVAPGQPGINWSRGRSVCEADNGNFYVTGCTYGSIYVLKLNPYGDTIWTRILGDGDAFAVVSSGDGGCVLTGGIGEPYTYKLNPNGDVVWHKTYGGFNKTCHDMKKTPDGGYIACGRDAAGPNEDAYVLKVDSAGNLQWQRSYTSGYAIFYGSIEIAHDGGYVVSGFINHQPWPQDTGWALIRKLSEAGDVVWEKQYRGIGTKKVIRYGDGYMLGGSQGSWDTMYVVLTRTNIQGDTLFKRILPTNTNYEEFNNIRLTNNGRIVVSSLKDTLNGNSGLGKARILDTNLNVIYENSFPTPDYILMYSVLPLPNGDILFAGEADFPGVPFSVYALRTDSMLRAPEIVIGIKQVSGSIPEKFELSQNYPNPFNPLTTIKYDIPSDGLVTLGIYDITGREVMNSNVYRTAGSYSTTFDGTNFASGMYIYKIESGIYSETKKMVLLK